MSSSSDNTVSLLGFWAMFVFAITMTLRQSRLFSLNQHGPYIAFYALLGACWLTLPSSIDAM